jgi:ABC-type multidrug transport system fused ATPase/permease subunit
MPPRKPPEAEEMLGKAFDWTLTKRLLTFLAPYRRDVRIGMALSLLIAGLGLAGPLLLKSVIDKAIARGSMPMLLSLSFAYLAVQFLNWRVGYDQQVRLATLAQNVLFDLRDTLFGHVQRLSLDFFDSQASGRLISRLTNDIEALNEIITSGAINLLADGLSLLGIVVVMLWLNWRLALMTFLLIPVITVVSRLFGRKARVAFRESRKKIATVTANIAESISGVRVTKSFGREQQNLQRFDTVNRENMKASLAAVMVFAIYFPVLELIAAIGTMLVLWQGGLLVLHHVPGATIGMLAAFLGYVERFFQPIRNTTRLYNSLQSAMASGERVYQILDTEPTVTEKPDAVVLPPVRGEVVFENVRFGYLPGQEILHDLSVHIAPGESIAIVGPTGAGKSTLISLLARLYDVNSGRITLDGLDIRDVTMASLRRQLGVVLQDSYLFSGTVRENIAYGRPEATEAEIHQAAATVGADRFIARLPQGYDTPVEERGQRLSAGQRQLVSFARAVLADPRILILDEATASIDAYTESLIQEAMRVLLKGRTSFIIAHRLSTVVEADRILVLQNGRIVEQGSHAELLAHSGLYAQLYARQFAEEKTEEAQEGDAPTLSGPGAG